MKVRILSRLKNMLWSSSPRETFFSHGFLISQIEEMKLLLGKQLIHTLSRNHFDRLVDYEFKVYSRGGDDGIIQFLIDRLNPPHHTFIELGVENYTESNTRFLLKNNNWSGLVIDGSKSNIDYIINDKIYVFHELLAIHKFINKKNINETLLAWKKNKSIGILSIDIDGNDYWIWEALNSVDPDIVIIEYNAVFGNIRPITIPYQANFYRTQKHYSNLYFGASLPALKYLADKKGYRLVGCDSLGSNAYFVKKEHYSKLPENLLKGEFIPSKFRESRDEKGELNFLSGKDRLIKILGLPVINVITQQEEVL